MRPVVALALLSFSLDSGLCLADTTHDGDEKACRELLSKGQQLTRVAEEDANARGREFIRRAETICQQEAIPPQLRAWAHMLTALLYHDDPRRPRELWHEAVSILRAEAPESELLPKALEGLTGAEAALGRLEEAVRIAHEALAVRDRVFGVDSRHHVRGLTFLAAVYEGLADAEPDNREAHLLQAQAYAEEAMAVGRRLLGLRDGTTGGAAAALASVLRSRGLTAEAEALLEETAPYVDLEDPLDLDDPLK